MRRRKRIICGVGILGFLGLAAGCAQEMAPGLVGAGITELRGRAEGVARIFTGDASVDQRLEQYALPARARLEPYFDRAGVAYPPAEVVLLGLKRERRLELYARGAQGPMAFVRAYPVVAASGGPGPKRREGDRQVPEGFYRIRFLNPNSRYHLSMGLDYPNEFDRRMARREGRRRLGGQIMIHGRDVSSGCLAVGDPAIEELFVLAAQSGHQNVSVIIAPEDLRLRGRPLAELNQAPWVIGMYREILRRMGELPLAVAWGA